MTNFISVTDVGLQNCKDLMFQVDACCSSSLTEEKPKVLKVNELKDIVSATIVSIDNAIFKMGSREMNLITKLNVSVKEDCLLNDETGELSFHMWEEQLPLFTNKKTYNLQYLVLKTYAGDRYLASTRKTVAEEVTDNPQIPINDEYDEGIDNFSIIPFELVKNVEIFYACNNCKKKVPVTHAKKIKYNACGSAFRSIKCKRNTTCELKFTSCECKKKSGMVSTDIISKELSWQSKDISDVTVSGIEEAFLSWKRKC